MTFWPLQRFQSSALTEIHSLPPPLEVLISRRSSRKMLTQVLALQFFKVKAQ
jgi:hypothetical protein